MALAMDKVDDDDVRLHFRSGEVGGHMMAKANF